MPIQRIHHVAYRCHDAKQTVEWYRKHLGMDFVLAIAEDRVPSTHAPDPYMHLFMDAGGGNILAFFELPNAPAMGRDEATPDWVQHIAFKVDSVQELHDTKARLEAAGVLRQMLGRIEAEQQFPEGFQHLLGQAGAHLILVLAACR